jgi:hypothetical protein
LLDEKPITSIMAMTHHHQQRRHSTNCCPSRKIILQAKNPAPATDALCRIASSRQSKRIKIEVDCADESSSMLMIKVHEKSFDLQELARASTTIADSLNFPLIGWSTADDSVIQERRSSLQHQHSPDDVQLFLGKVSHNNTTRINSQYVQQCKKQDRRDFAPSSKRQLVRSIALHKQLSSLAHSSTRS